MNDFGQQTKEQPGNSVILRTFNLVEKNCKSIGRILSRNIIHDKIFFLHIPKCGGTSADTAIQEAYRWKACVHLNSRASRRSSLFLGDELARHRNQLLAYFLEQEQLQYVSGHFTFNEKVFDAYSNRWNFITMLRNPVDKFISQYFYNHQKNNQDHFGISASLEEFLETDDGRSLGSDYAHKFSGSLNPQSTLSETHGDAVQRAVNNLKKFKLVGFLENTEAFQAGFRESFGATLNIKQMNKNPDKKTADISKQTRKKIEMLCETDMEIYSRARKLFLKSD
jgi:hypothetical protein